MKNKTRYLGVNYEENSNNSGSSGLGRCDGSWLSDRFDGARTRRPWWPRRRSRDLQKPRLPRWSSLRRISWEPRPFQPLWLSQPRSLPALQALWISRLLLGKPLLFVRIPVSLRRRLSLLPVVSQPFEEPSEWADLPSASPFDD